MQIVISQMRKTRKFRGGAIQKMLVDRFMQAGYMSIESPSADRVAIGRDNYTLDREISTDRSKVYVKLGANGRPEKVYVVHRGTDSKADSFNNLAIPFREWYKSLPRYIEAAGVQRNANTKYTGIPVHTISHSQGGYLVSCLMYDHLARGLNITMNPAILTRPTVGRMFIIRSEDDPISVFVQTPNMTLPSARRSWSLFGRRIPSVREMKEAHSASFLGRQRDFAIGEPGDPVPDFEPQPRLWRTPTLRVSPIRSAPREPEHRSMSRP